MIFNDEIIEIIEFKEEDTIDIEVSGNHLFFANGILTHNSAYDTGDVDLTNTSESMGLVFTSDCILGLISTEELESMGQIMVKQLKNRWNDLGYYRRFIVGIDRSKMKLYDVEKGGQDNIYNEDVKPNENSDNKFKLKDGKKNLVLEGLK